MGHMKFKCPRCAYYNRLSGHVSNSDYNPGYVTLDLDTFVSGTEVVCDDPDIKCYLTITRVDMGLNVTFQLDKENKFSHFESLPVMNVYHQPTVEDGVPTWVI